MYQVADPTPPSPPPLPRALSIELDIPCSRCGYILRGLKTSSRCPECAAPIKLSVFGDRIQYAAPGYVRSLNVGATLLAIAVAVQLVCTTVAVATLLILATLSNGTPPRWLAWFAVSAFFVLPGLTSAAALFGWWLLTSPDPALLATPADPRSRRRLRAILIAESFFWLVLSGLGLIGTLALVPPTVYIPIAYVSGLLAPIAILAHLVVSARYFRDIGPRLPTLFAPETARLQLWAAAASTGAVLLCVLAVYSGSGGLIISTFVLAFLALASLACVHIALAEIIRRATRDALVAQQSGRPGEQARRKSR